MANLIVIHNDYTQEKAYDTLLSYITNPEKAVYVGSVNLFRERGIDAMVEQMLNLTKELGAMGGQLLKHLILSFDSCGTEAWVTPELAYSIAMQICQKILYHYQVAFAVHTNKDNLHIHFVINSVDYNGYKFEDTQSCYKALKKNIRKLEVGAEEEKQHLRCELVYRNNNMYTK